MKLVFTLILSLYITTATVAQTDAYSEAVKQCITSNQTITYYDTVVDEMFAMIKQQYVSKEVPEKVWYELESLKPNALDELSQMIVSSYRAHFSLEDVNNMNALYSTHAGKNMFTNPKALTEDDQKKLREFYHTKTGQKIINSQESLTKSLSQVSEIWSSDLYKMVTQKLADKGYSL